MMELKLANTYMRRRGADYGSFWGRIPPLPWLEDELRYWMPALARECCPYCPTPWGVDLRLGLVVLAVATMLYDISDYGDPQETQGN